ncbi:hypothetical protein CPB84DRAFT_360871 [Gymnopilus junonius]|uniref:Uncharacterized protein n=1 Tax=Gymnopilus junonius TaxID=109634 RepID=A0A9P5NUB8_GYMJU|nr:hypothetical protein CPB84DRAFT_360871 [Gymnopilus junonius]
MSYESPALAQDILSAVSPVDRERLLHLPLAPHLRVLLFEEMLDRYSDSMEIQPYLLLGLADQISSLGSVSVALEFYFKAQNILAEMGTIDKVLNRRVEKLATEVNKQTAEKLAKSRLLPYHQKWRPTREYKFPTNLPHLPLGSQEVLERWREMTAVEFTGAYLRKLAIETNHIEGVFLLTDSARFLFFNGSELLYLIMSVFCLVGARPSHARD